MPANGAKRASEPRAICLGHGKSAGASLKCEADVHPPHGADRRNNSSDPWIRLGGVSLASFEASEKPPASL